MTSLSDALALRATAAAFDAQRGKLPILGDQYRSPDVATLSRQITELGSLISDLGNQMLLRAAEPGHASRTDRVVNVLAEAVDPASRAASQLGRAAHELAFLTQTEQLRHQPDAADAREAATCAVEEALESAGAALYEAATALHTASAAVSPPSGRLRAARSRTTTDIPTAGSSLSGTNAPAATPQPDRNARGR